MRKQDFLVTSSIHDESNPFDVQRHLKDAMLCDRKFYRTQREEMFFKSSLAVVNSIIMW